MRKHSLHWSLVLLACLTTAACQDRREPVKPTVGLSAPASKAA